MNGRHTKSGWHKTGNSRGLSGDFIVYRPAVHAGFFAAGFRGAIPCGDPLQRGRKQKCGIKSRSICGNPGRNGCENVRRRTFCREKKACSFADLPDFPAFQKNLLTGFSRTVTLPGPSFSFVPAFRMRLSGSRESSFRALLWLWLNAHECPRLLPVLISHNEFQRSVEGDESPDFIRNSPHAVFCMRVGLYFRLRDDRICSAPREAAQSTYGTSE